MPGAGKAIVSQVAKEVCYSVFVCGDVIRSEARRRGISPTPAGLGELMIKLRQEEGSSVIVKRLLPKIIRSKSNKVLVEGVRSCEEIEELRRHFGRVFTLAIHASPETRFKRLSARGRKDDPKDWHEFMERDMRELSVGLGAVIALSQAILVNEGSISKLRKDAAKFLRGVGA
jgi:dephospho-CoA kinase